MNDPNQRQSPFDRDKLRDLTEKIQVGDAEEGAQALEELIEHAWERGSANVRQEVERERIERQMREEGLAALDNFGKKWPAIKDNKLMSEAAVHALRDEYVKDLKTAGLSDADLAPIANDAGRLATAHSIARSRGVKLRSPGELLDKTGETLGESFNIKPARRSPEEYVRDMRDARGFKRDGTHRFDHEPPASSDPSVDATRRWVQQARAARGFAARSDR
jgi:hypothetical protein